MDDVASGARNFLAAAPSVTALVGAFPPTDPIIPNRNQPWIFKDDLLVLMEGTSSAAIKTASGGGWSVPMPLTTPRFRRLIVTVYADPLRDANRNIIETSGGTIQRGEQVFDAIRGVLVFTNNPDVLWGDLRVVGCEVLAEPAAWTPVPDGDGLQSAFATFGVLSFGNTEGVAG